MSEVASRQRRGVEERALAMILPVIERLRVVVETENRELTQRGPVDYNSHSQRKNQGLLELSRLRPALGSAQSSPAAQTAFADLSAQLEINRRLLHTQLRAAQTISGIVARAIREGQSDGTYSPHPWREEER